jgi:hypothetical protein
MANIINGRTCVIDTPGVIFTTPVRLSQAIFFPAATPYSYMAMHSWDESVTPDAEVIDVATSVTDPYITSTGAFASLGSWSFFSNYYILKITSTSSGNNIGYFQGWASDDDNFSVDSYPALTDEVNKTYSWKAWRIEEFVIKACPSDAIETQIFDFGDRWVPNLGISNMNSGDVVHLILS